jgi:hypothetical protein
MRIIKRTAPLPPELTERQRDQRWAEALRDENIRRTGGTPNYGKCDPVEPHEHLDDWGGVKL